jgi:hypothetical protein
LVKEIGKLIRQVNHEKPIKLTMSRLVNKQSIGYLLSGLKGNKQVYELNLTDCGLEDEELKKITNRLKNDNGIKSIKLG